MTRYFTVLAAFILSLAVLTGCQTQNVNVPPRIDYGQFGIMRLDVAKIVIVDEYIPPLRAPNVEHQFPTPLYKAVNEWAQRRFQAIGTAGEARIIIKNASAVEEQLPTREGLEGAFYVEQDRNIVARILVRVEVDSPLYGPSTFTDISVEQSSTLAENTTLMSRDQIFNKLTRDSLITLNTRAVESLQKTVSAVIR